MIATETQKKIIKKAEKLLKIRITDIQIPPQGMDSEVFFAADDSNKEYVIKYYDRGSRSDIPAFELLKKNNIDIPVPKVFGAFIFENKEVAIFEKINFPLLDSISADEMHRYIPSMVENLKKIHRIKSDKAGLVDESGKKRRWKEIMLSKFNNIDPNLNWNVIAKRNGLVSKLVLRSVENIIRKIEETDFIDSSYSFLHTDFNQRNLFVNLNSDEIAGIIDWGEAMFGDPIYDFARVRMFIWHFNLGNDVLENYYKLLPFTTKQRQLEELYWLCRVMEYLAYYSEELNEFNVGRIKLHQEFLRMHEWE